MSRALIIRAWPGRHLWEHTHRRAGWSGLRYMLLSLVVLLLVACGLEPRYVHPPPERYDEAFLWVNVLDTPPIEYLPVTFDDPETGAGREVCRAWIVDGPEPDQGYHTGELRRDGSGVGACLVGHRGDMVRFSHSDNAYQQLWGRDGALYKWEPIDMFPERPLWRSALWTANRVPGDYVRRTDSNAPVEYWMPCAAPFEGRWYLGKLGLQDSEPLYCYVQLADREVRISSGVLVLFAPVD